MTPDDADPAPSPDRSEEPPDLGDAHVGLLVALGAVAITWWVAERPGWSLAIVAVLAVWFVVALAFITALGGRGRSAVRRAYAATFGWLTYF
ncbi:hypothetical protein [Kitasatospora sp. NPDC058218]|uniref:hypothetical protein n=1 Tax=Kitasatospora sp. NPDC058218 TaxID=3346385 RepID=UPI0036D85CDF